MLAGLILLHALVNVYWISADVTLRSYDASPHLEAQVHAARLLKTQGLTGLSHLVRSVEPGWWPSAQYIPWGLLTLILGEHMQNMRFFLLGYLALLLVSVYHVGRLLCSRQAGLLAAVLLGFLPVVYGEGRNYGVDMPGTAMLTACVWMLLASRGFTRPWQVTGLAAALGWGVLVRPQMLFFFAPLGFVVLVIALRRPGETPRLRILAAAALAALGAAAISSVWWWGNLAELLRILMHHQVQSGPLSGNFEANGPFYLRMIPWALTPWTVLFFGASLLGWRASNLARRGPEWILPWAWLLGGAAIILVIKVHFIRFLLPVCPAFALITAMGLLSIRWRRLRQVLVVLAVAASAACWITDSTVAVLGPGGIIPRSWIGDSPHGLSSGPPRTDPALTAAHRVVRQLQIKHGRGERLDVQMCCTGDEPLDNYFLRAGPMLVLGLPGARIHGQPYVQSYAHERPPFLRIGGVVMPPLATRPGARQRYFVCFGPPPARPTQVLELGGGHKRLLFQTVVPSLHQQWVTLWR